LFDHQGLITRLRYIIVELHDMYAFDAASVTTADNPRSETLTDKEAGQFYKYWRLAGTTGSDITDHDQGNIEVDRMA
jgi:hypothetical protein